MSLLSIIVRLKLEPVRATVISRCVSIIPENSREGKGGRPGWAIDKWEEFIYTAKS
jgi:hypothetical protein